VGCEPLRGMSFTRKWSSTMRPPVLGWRFKDHFCAEGSLSSFARWAEDVGYVWTSSRAFWMKGFIMRPVDQTHIPTPNSPSSLVLKVKQPPSVLGFEEPGSPGRNSWIWCSVLIWMPSRRKRLSAYSARELSNIGRILGATS